MQVNQITDDEAFELLLKCQKDIKVIDEKLDFYKKVFDFTQNYEREYKRGINE